MASKKTPQQMRDQFVERFGQPALNAMVTIVKTQAGRKVPSRIGTITPSSLAAYRANLTRGTYKGFVTVNKSQKINDRMDLVSVR